MQIVKEYERILKSYKAKTAAIAKAEQVVKEEMEKAEQENQDSKKEKRKQVKSELEDK